VSQLQVLEAVLGDGVTTSPALGQPVGDLRAAIM
jgi:hypothetical protein